MERKELSTPCWGWDGDEMAVVGGRDGRDTVAPPVELAMAVQSGFFLRTNGRDSRYRCRYSLIYVF